MGHPWPTELAVVPRWRGRLAGLCFRVLVLTPRYWAATRARLDARELELPLGRLTVPEPPAKQAAAS